MLYIDFFFNFFAAYMISFVQMHLIYNNYVRVIRFWVFIEIHFYRKVVIFIHYLFYHLVVTVFKAQRPLPLML